MVNFKKGFFILTILIFSCGQNRNVPSGGSSQNSGNSEIVTYSVKRKLLTQAPVTTILKKNKIITMYERKTGLLDKSDQF